MNKLMNQLRDSKQTEGRKKDLCANWNSRVILFKREFNVYDKQRGWIWITPNFYIDTKPTETGSNPIVTSPYVNNFKALGHGNHLFSDHSLCLGNNLANWDLFSLLRQIEKWFGGFYEWTQTGVFPDYWAIF